MSGGYDARKHLGQLKEIGICKVIVVDDDKDLDESEQTLGAFSAINAMLGELSDQQIADIKELDLNRYDIRLFDVNGNIDEAFMHSESFPEHWNSVPVELKKSFFDIVDMQDTREQTREVFGEFEGLVSEIIPVEFLSVSEWTQYKNDSSHIDEGFYAILLFDQNLKNASIPDIGEGRYGEAGKRLAKEMLEEKNARYIPGIFTANVGIGGDEIEETDNQFISGYQIGVISKERTKNSKNLIRGLEAVVAANILYRLGEIAREIIRQVAEANVSGKASIFNSIGLAALLQMIRQSEKEGEHPSNGVIRLINEMLNQITTLRMRYYAATDEKVKLIGRLDDFVKFSSIFQLDEEDDADYLLRFHDAYIMGEDLAEGHFPTGNGDIYELTLSCGETIDCVLLAQPCNLAIRGDDDYRSGDITHLPLIELEKRDRRRNGEIKQNHDPQFGSPIPYPDSESSDKEEYYCQPNFKKCRYIPPYLLDLCAFGRDGISSSDIDGLANIEMLLESGWMNARNYLIKDLKSRIAEYKAIQERTDIDGEELSFDYAKNSAFDVTRGYPRIEVTNDGIFHFGIRRKARLKEKHAHGLLHEFARYQSRYGFPSRLL